MDTSQSTVFGNVYANPDGTWTSTNATGPVQVKDSKGAWHSIDPNLVAGKDGRLREKWGLDDASFSPGGDATVATMSNQGVPASWSWPTKLPKPSIQGNVATYKISDGEDLVVTATGTGFTEDVVLTKRPTAAQSLVLPMTAKGGSFSKTANGGLQVKNAHGKQAMFIPKPFAFDSSKNAGGDPQVAAIDTTVGSDGSMTLAPDAAFLLSPSTVYPVTIDPGFTIYNGNDTWLENPDYTTSQYSSTELKVGTYDGGTHVARSYLGFPQTNFVGRHILSANLVLDNWYSGSCTAGNIYAERITANWNSQTITWSTLPPVTATDEVAYSPAHGYSSSCPGGNATWNITAMAQAWSNGTARDGIALRAGSETSNYSWRRYYSSNYGTTADRPYITATFNTYPSTPTAPTFTNATSYTPSGGTASTYVSTGKPTASSKVTDGDGGTLKATFGYYTSETASTPSGSCTSAWVASGSIASCALSTALPDGTYYIKSDAYDGTDYSKSYSSWSTVIVAAGQPAAPVINCTGYPDSSWAATPPSTNIPCTISAAGSGVSAPAKIHYTVDGVSNTAVITQSSDPGVAQTQVTVSNLNGAHAITATALNPAGVSSNPQSLGFGFGTLAMSSPSAANVLRASDNVAIAAAGPAASDPNAALSATLQWRLAGSATASWTNAATFPGALTVHNNGSAGVTVTGTWDSSTDLGKPAAAGGPGLDLRIPQLLDVQVCVTYTSSTTQCTDSVSPTQVLHVAHAFGSGFPTTDVQGGQVALWTGEFQSSSTDATLAAGTTSLSIGRTASSLDGPDVNPATNVFGPGWTADLTGDAAGHADAQVTDATVEQGVIAVQDSDGDTLLYQPSTGLARRTAGSLPLAWVPVDDFTRESGITAKIANSTDSHDPAGTQLLTLTDPDGTTTVFKTIKVPAAGVDATFGPGSVTEPGSASSTTYSYDSAGRVTQILAPTPAAGCSPMTTGCRGLDIHYATTTTATGGANPTPGDFAGQVQGIYTLIDGVESTLPVEKYLYDASGRLVSATDNRPNTPLTTTYTYDGTSDRVASITDPGLTPVYYHYNSNDELDQVTRAQDATDTPTGIAPTADLATIVYGIPTTNTAGANSAGLPDLSQTTVNEWEQPSAPTYGAAVFGPDHGFSTIPTAASLTSADGPYASLYYTNGEGYTTNTGNYGAGQWLLTDTEYDALGNVTRQLSASDLATIQAAFAANAEVDATQFGQLTVYNTQVTDGSGNIVLPADTEVTDTYDTARYVTMADGSQQVMRPHTHTDYDQGAPNNKINTATGQQFGLATTVTTGVADPTAVDKNPASVIDAQVNSITKTGYDNAVPGNSDPNIGWEQGLASTTTTVMDNSVSGGVSGAAPITKTTTYNTQGQTVSTRQPMSNGSDAGTRNTVYYQSGTGSGVAACDNHPQWQGLVCQTNYAANPTGGPSGDPGMVTTTTTYTNLQQPATVTEDVSGATTRTTTTSYDNAGRTTGTSVVVAGLSGSTPVPATTITYWPATGLQESTQTAGGVNGGTITTTYDSWGRVNTYVNSSGPTTTTYDAAGNKATVTSPDGAVTTYMTDGNDANGNAEHRGLVTSQTTTAHGASATITAAYDTSGNVINENYGGGVSLTNTYDAGGNLVARYYSGDVTVGGTVVPDSQWIGWSQDIDAAGRVAAIWTPDDAGATSGATGAAATGYSDAYTYDPADRLTQVVDQTIPAGAANPVTGVGIDDSGDVTGGTCTIRTYSFDANGNRTAKSVIPANADGSCQSTTSATGAVTTTWSHDTADRIANTGYVYDNLGRTTTIPQVDTPLAQAGGTPGNLSLSYYDTDQIQAQTQNGTTVTNTLDASGRPLTQTTGPTGGSVTSTTTMGYTDDSDSPGYETTTTGGTTTSESYVNGPDGQLGATLTSNGTVQLAVSDPNGDSVSQITLPNGADAAGLDDWSNNDEYGNPDNPTTAGTTATNPTGDATGGLGYGWEGAHKRDTDTTGMVQMGARLYNPVTGTFSSADAVFGGNSTAYTYPQDPINGSDLTGNCWICDAWHATTHFVSHVYHATTHFVRRHWRGILTTAAIGGCVVMSAGACAAATMGASLFIHGWNYTHHEESFRHAFFGVATDALFAGAGYGLGRFGEGYVEEFGHSYRRWSYLNNFHAGLPGMAYAGAESWHHWHGE